MFDIGMSELLVIGIVALIVIGPKDLPALFHTLGRFTAKARALGREFTNAMNDAARESGVSDAANTLKGVGNPRKFGLDKLNEAADRFDKWDPAAKAGEKAAKGKPPARPEPDAERAADVEKIRAATEKAGRAKLDREAAAKAEAAAAEAGQAPKKAPAKSAAKKAPAAKTTTAKTTTAKKPAARKAPARKPAAGKAPARKPAATKAAKPATADKADSE